jgi:hypothetical protein
MDDDGEDQIAKQVDLTEDDDGEADEVVTAEIVEADQFEVSQADSETDWNRAIRYAVGFLGGIAALHGVLPDALTTMALPAISDIMTALVRVGRRRVEHAGETLMDAAAATDLPLDEFFDKAVADDRRQELLARTLNIAQDTSRRDKRRALGRALAAGVMGDDARIDEELLFIRAVDDIDEWHIRLLDRMDTTHIYGPGWSAYKILDADLGLSTGVHAIIGTLETHGLIAESAQSAPVAGADKGPFYVITDQGRMFLDRLREDSD